MGIFRFYIQGPEENIFSSREKIIFLGTLDIFLPDVFYKPLKLKEKYCEKYLLVNLSF